MMIVESMSVTCLCSRTVVNVNNCVLSEMFERKFHVKQIKELQCAVHLIERLRLHLVDIFQV